MHLRQHPLGTSLLVAGVMLSMAGCHNGDAEHADGPEAGGTKASSTVAATGGGKTTGQGGAAALSSATGVGGSVPSNTSVAAAGRGNSTGGATSIHAAGNGATVDPGSSIAGTSATGSTGGASAALGGASAAGAAMGGASTTPTAVNAITVQSPSGIIDKMDILMSIDNSLSMGDKQQVLAAALPQLLRRLTNPDCVDDAPGSALAPVAMASPDDACPQGMEREFTPIKDIHIGVVTSSLGDFGGDTCPESGAQNIAMNDHAWLLGGLSRTHDTLPEFLSWTKADATNFVTSIQPKLTEFKNMVAAATELGCGNEMVLESWYRFLIDPKPPTDIVTESNAANKRGPVDSTILQQRKAFLRPDSLVTVLMLSDENDCSMRDDDYSWVPATAGAGFRMWRGSSVCATNPNDPCCYSCMLDSFATEACKALDTSCRQSDPGAKLLSANDDINLRCRSMKKRFGHDFLFPTSRYVNALTKLQLCPDQSYGDLDCDCTEARAKGLPCVPGTPVPNPLYQNLDASYTPTGPVRIDSSSVFLAGIVGVPWQDLAVDGALAANAPLRYRMAQELNWDLFAPRDSITPPLDPLMIEQTEPRTGTHPITKEPLAPPTAGRMANSINGHEWITASKDVQFACIFSLEQPISGTTVNATRTCDLTAECGVDDGSDEYRICARRFDGCSCTTYADNANNPLDPRISLSPLCQAPSASYGNKQYFAKAYPGVRELQVLRGFYESTSPRSNNAIVASICPKDLNVANANGAGYGYNPAMQALVDRLKDNIGGTCLPQRLVADAGTGKVPCAMIEAITPEGAAKGSCSCEAKQRDAVDAGTQQALIQVLEERGTCTGSDCERFCFCRLRQLLPGTAAGDACLNDLGATRTAPAPGFCYVEPPNYGTRSLVSACDPNEQRTLRIVGNTALGLGAPAIGPVFYTCSGSPFVVDGVATP